MKNSIVVIAGIIVISALMLAGVMLDRKILRPEQQVIINDTLRITQPVDTVSIVSAANSGLVVLTPSEYSALFNVTSPIPLEIPPADSGLTAVSFDTTATLSADSSAWSLSIDVGLHIDVLLSDPPVANIDLTMESASVRYHSHPITFDPAPIPLMSHDSSGLYTKRQLIMTGVGCAVAGSASTYLLLRLAVALIPK